MSIRFPQLLRFLPELGGYASASGFSIRGDVRLDRSGSGGMRQQTSCIQGPYTGLAPACNDLKDSFSEFPC
jgi:hypothetical protein